MGKYIGIISSMISILALFLVDTDHPYIRATSFAIGIIAFILSLFLEIYSYKQNKPLQFDRKGNIEYMHNIIKNEGKIIIFAGDLSWVDNDEIKNALLDKKDKLSLCVKDSAPYIDEFKKAGVKVYTYEDNEFTPTTRFTIIRPKSANEKIAITAIHDSHNKEKRLVYEISKDDENFKNKWIVYAAEDLFNLMKVISEGK